MPALIAFDLDGTLIDTEAKTLPDLIRCFNEDFALPMTMETWMQHFHGMSGPPMINKVNAMFGTDLTFESFMPVRNKRLEAIFADGVNPAPGMLQAIRTLHAQGAPICICSNSTYARISLTLANANGQHTHGANLAEIFKSRIFSAVGSIEKPGKAKPAPDVYLAAAKHFAVPPKQCLAVEDSLTGLESALAAGFTCWGYTALTPHPDEDALKLTAAGAKKTFPHWDNFLPLLSKWKPKK